MKPTRRGLAAAFVAVSLALDSAVFMDSIMEIALLCLLAVIVSEAAWVEVARARLRSAITLSGEGPCVGKSAILYPGDRSAERVHMAKGIGGEVRLRSRIPFLKIEPGTVGSRVRESDLEFEFGTEYAGEYSSDEVGVEVRGPLGLFSTWGAVPIAQEYVVHPRLLAVAATTARLLGKGARGEAPIDIPGAGGEFYELRDYQQGDDLRSVNWKATARRGEVMVNQRTAEAGSSFLLVLDARAPGFRDVDRLASAFLSVANALAQSAAEFGVLVHDGRSVRATSDGPGSLETALKAALGLVRLGSAPEFLELAPVRTALDPALDVEVLAGMSELHRAALGSLLQSSDPWASASRYFRDGSARSVIYVSGVFEDLEPLIELAWQLKRQRDVDFLVANPCEPWVSASGEGDAERLRAREKRVAAALTAAGIEYHRGEPAELVRRALPA